jgi:hypothetical protein
MLYLVLLLVVASLGLLIAALTTANTLWAWISVLISVIATGLLILDWVRNRRRRSQAAPAADRVPEERAFVPQAPPPPSAPPLSAPPSSEQSPPPPSAAEITMGVEEFDFDPVPVQAPSAEDPNVEPAEENTDATDLLVVSELSDEVVVIDERPRYHLVMCVWLGDRPTLPLPVSEARELGFTPCGRCSPDATLAAKHRAERAHS